MKIPSRQSFWVKQQRKIMRRILRKSLPLLGIRHDGSWVRQHPFRVRQWQVEAWVPSYCHLCTRENDHSGLSLGGVSGILVGLEIKFASTQRWWLKPRLCSWRDKLNKKKGKWTKSWGILALEKLVKESVKVRSEVSSEPILQKLGQARGSRKIRFTRKLFAGLRM